MRGGAGNAGRPGMGLGEQRACKLRAGLSWVEDGHPGLGCVDRMGIKRSEAAQSNREDSAAWSRGGWPISSSKVVRPTAMFSRNTPGRFRFDAVSKPA